MNQFSPSVTRFQQHIYMCCLWLIMKEEDQPFKLYFPHCSVCKRSGMWNVGYKAIPFPAGGAWLIQEPAGAVYRHLKCSTAPHGILAQKYCRAPAPKYKRYLHPKWVPAPSSVQVKHWFQVNVMVIFPIIVVAYFAQLCKDTKKHATLKLMRHSLQLSIE